MKLTSNQPLDRIFEALFQPYSERVPDVKRITNAMVKRGMVSNQSDIINDHVAFRTLGVPHLGIQSFEKIFLHHGYEKKDHYFFEGKRLDAYWYSPPEPHYPRAFISELRVEDLSSKTQSIIHQYISHIDNDPVDHIDLDDPVQVGDFFHKPLWDLVSYTDYSSLLDESEVGLRRLFWPGKEYRGISCGKSVQYLLYTRREALFATESSYLFLPPEK